MLMDQLTDKNRKEGELKATLVVNTFNYYSLFVIILIAILELLFHHRDARTRF